jgi:magnesium-transporting ATPase (P-type)
MDCCGDDIKNVPSMVQPDPVNPQEDVEGDDMVSSMRKIAAVTEGKVKTRSDISGMEDGIQEPRRRVKAISDVSDIVLDKLGTAGATDDPAPRRRQISSSDVGVSFNQAPILGFDDLKLADNVAAYGTAQERKGTIMEDDFQEMMKEGDEAPFVFNHVGLTSEEAAKRLIQYGRNELPESIDPKWLVFLRQFWAPMPIMIWIAIIIEAGIENWIDMGILLLIQFANASISFYETNKAGNAVAALKSSLKPTATVKRDGEWKVIDGGTVVPGDMVLLASGSAIPADCRVNGSEIDVDQAALTGESLPVTFYKGDSCKMGSTVVRGEVEVRVQSALRATDAMGRFVSNRNSIYNFSAGYGRVYRSQHLFRKDREFAQEHS